MVTSSAPALHARTCASGPEAERRGAAGHRIRLLRAARGKVLELGAGSGLNFPRYPSEATEVIAVEPEPRGKRR